MKLVEHPASNLLAWDVNKNKWLCRKGETSCSIVLQLSKAVKICSVNIGAHQAALVEVLVGRSETPNEPFQVLVPSCVLQSPAEARRAAPSAADRVRSFGADGLAAARAQRWDRLRVVASQPYNKHCQFGLSFVHVYSEESGPAPAPALTPAPAPAPALVPSPAPSPTPDLHSSDEEQFRPGELFAQHVQKPKDTVDTSGRIRQASSHALHNIPDSSVKLTKATIVKPSPSHQRASTPLERETDRRRDSLLYTPDDDRPHDKVERVVNRHKEQKTNEQTNTQEDAARDVTDGGTPRGDPPAGQRGAAGSRDGNKYDGHPRKRKKHDDLSGDGTKYDDLSGDKRKHNDLSGDKKKHDDLSSDAKKHKGSKKRSHTDNSDDNRAGPVSAAPHTLLADVVFVLSGYQNPERASLRTAALALGATHRRDWGVGCTHLICAFPNTPKLRAVRAGPDGARAVAVRGEWVQQTARTRRRLPWQWFATEDARRTRPPPGWDAAPTPPESECDTDDEIERVRRDMKERGAGGSPDGDVTSAPGGRVQANGTVVESDSCGGSTDEDEKGAEHPPTPRGDRLPALFAGLVFSVDARAPRAALLRRYLRAYGGLVAQEADSEVDYVVCERGGEEGAGVRVRAAWVWRCHETRRLCPADDFLLTPTSTSRLNTAH